MHCEDKKMTEEVKPIRVLFTGDSWISAVMADKLSNPNAGWTEMLSKEEGLYTTRHGIAGSRAIQWAEDRDGILTQAKACKADTVFISLMGNDMRDALSDGSLTIKELMTSAKALETVVRELRRKRTIVMLYTNPFPGDEVSEFLVKFLNNLIMMACAEIELTTAEEDEGYEELNFFESYKILGEGDFDGTDIHALEKGHVNMAEIIGANLKEEILSSEFFCSGMMV